MGIEEQLYLLWPPLVVYAWKRKANLLDLSLSIVAVSFAINVILVSLWQARETYFLPPTRFWELLLGGILAYAHLFKKDQLDHVLRRIGSHLPTRRFVSLHDLQATVGLFLLLLALVILDTESLFPGWWALLPTLGAFLLISAGPNAWISRTLLSARPVVFIGLISYPLYLWHWPLLSYAQIIESGHPSRLIVLAALALSFVLASLTYQSVEKPIRVRANGTALVLILSLTIVGGVGLACFAHVLHARSEAYGLDKIIKASAEWGFPGHLTPVHTRLGYHWQQGTAPPKVLFVGDSNMEQYYPRINKLLTEHPRTTRSVLFLTQPRCAPIPYVKEFADHQCVTGVVERAFALAQHPDVDTVVIGAAWNGYVAFNDPNARERSFRDLEAMAVSYRKLGRHVYLILPIPRAEAFDPFHMVTRSIRDFGFKIIETQVARGRISADLQPITSRLRSIAHSTGAMAIDPVDYLCPQTLCPTFAADGLPIYRDIAHLRPSYVRDHVTFLDAIVSTRQ